MMTLVFVLIGKHLLFVKAAYCNARGPHMTQYIHHTLCNLKATYIAAYTNHYYDRIRNIIILEL